MGGGGLLSHDKPHTIRMRDHVKEHQRWHHRKHVTWALQPTLTKHDKR